MRSRSILIVCLFTLSGGVFAQVSDSTNNWDNQLYLGNRYVWSNDNWRYSGEFQVRLENDIRQLQQYYLEGVATYMPNENWEIVPDFRFTVHPDRIEFRPGLGVIYKSLWGKKLPNQLAHQVKWQADIEGTGVFKHGIRYILFYNRGLIKEKLGLTSGGGFFYRMSEDFNGIQFVRAFLGLAYQFNDVHALSFNYFVGAENRATHWEYIGGPFVTFVIRLDNDSKYVPAKYINF
jgi:hypothetical protein